MTETEIVVWTIVAGVGVWAVLTRILFSTFTESKNKIRKRARGTLPVCADCAHSERERDFDERDKQDEYAKCLHPASEQRDYSRDYHLGIESVVVSHHYCSNMRKSKCGRTAKYFLPKACGIPRKQWSEIG